MTIGVVITRADLRSPPSSVVLLFFFFLNVGVPQVKGLKKKDSAFEKEERNKELGSIRAVSGCLPW